MASRKNSDTPPRAAKSDESSYYQYVQSRLNELHAIFAAAAIGDFSKDIAIPEAEDEFTELYIGVQTMLEVIREKITELDRLNVDLKQVVQQRTMALDRSRSHLQSVVANAPNYIQMFDRNLRYTFINKGAAGVDLQAYIGRVFGESMRDKGEVNRIKAILRRVLNDGTTREYEYKAEIGSEERWYKSNAGPIIDGGQITGLVVTTFDITAEKLANEDLRQQKLAVELARQRDRALLNSIGDGLIVIDEQGRIANINPTAAKLLGYSRKELIGKWFTTTIAAYSLEGEPISPLERPAIRALTSGKPVAARARYRRKDGSTFPVTLNIAPVVLNKKPLGAIEVFRDITAETELEQAKEEFVSLASHQLRTPATGVKAYLSMLIDGYSGDFTARQAEFLQKIFDLNERQLQIVNDILNIARLDAGRIIPEMVSVNLSDLIDEVRDEQISTIQQRKQHLELLLPEGGVETVVDPSLMRMVLENLLSNASKYTPENGGITLELSTTGKEIVIKVTDTGVGIAEKDMAKLFQRFSRIPNHLGTARGGTGLGLYLTQNLIHLHGGKLEVASKPNVGSTFTIRLPKIVKLSKKPAQERIYDV